MRPRGNPPTPNAKSSAIEPVRTTSNAIRSWKSPIRMIEPLPNCRSICASALVRASCRSSSAAISIPFSLCLHHALTALCQGDGILIVFENRVDEFGWGEGTQVLGCFAEANELDRHLEVVDDRDKNAALRRRVELGDDDARQLGRRMEESRLRNRILTVRAVDDE